MDLQEIKDLGEKINEVADENCHLYLWVINPMLPEAIEVIRSWEKYGFIYKTCITWINKMDLEQAIIIGGKLNMCYFQ